MKRIVFIFASLVLAVTMVGAQSNTAPTTSVPMQITGSTILGIENKNIADSSFIGVFPSLAGQTATSDLALQFLFNTTQSYLDFSQYMDEVRKQGIMGYDAGITFDAANLYSFVAPQSQSSKAAESSMYSKLQLMIDWYENNATRFGIHNIPASLPGATWPTTSYGASSGRTRFIYGHTVMPVDMVVWNSTAWSDAEALFNGISTAIVTEIGTISANCDSGKIQQYTYVNLSQAEKTKALLEKRAYEEFNALVYGSNVSASFSGPVIKSAYLSLTNIGGLLDTRFDFSGVKVSASGIVKSPRAEQQATGPAVTLKLAPGVIQGLRVGVISTVTGGEKIVPDNFDTNTLEYNPGKPSWFGINVNAGYNFRQFIKFADIDVGASIVFPDLIERFDTMALKVTANYLQAGALVVESKSEVQALLWEDREVVADPIVFGFAGASNNKVTYLGLGGQLNLKFKDKNFGGTNANNFEDRFAGVNIDQDFDSVGNGWVVVSDLGMLLDPSAFLGMNVGSLNGGAKVFLYNALDLTALRGIGYYGEVTLKSQDLLNIPLTLVLGVNSYNNSGIQAYPKTLPTANLLDGMTYSGKLIFKASDNIFLNVKYENADASWRMSTQRLVTAGVNVEIKF